MGEINIFIEIAAWLLVLGEAVMAIGGASYSLGIMTESAERVIVVVGAYMMAAAVGIVVMLSLVTWLGGLL